MKRKLERISVCAAFFMALALVGCRTNPSAVNLSAQLHREAKFLAENQDKTVESYSAFTRSVEERVTPIVTNNLALYVAATNALVAKLTEEANSLEAGLKLAFELEALKLRTNLDHQIDTVFDPKLTNTIGQAYLAWVKSEANTTDVVAARKALKDLGRFAALQIAHREHTLKLVADFNKQIETNRVAIYAVIEQAARNWRAQITGQTNGPIAERLKAIRDSPPAPNVSLSEKREELAAFRATVAATHQTHLDSLAQMDEYINRPSGLRLFMSGAFEQARGRISALTAQLDPLAKLIDVNQLINVGGEALMTEVSSIEGQISALGSRLAGWVTKRIESAIPAIEAEGEEALSTKG
jgi:hypothetical protein